MNVSVHRLRESDKRYFKPEERLLNTCCMSRTSPRANKIATVPITAAIST